MSVELRIKISTTSIEPDISRQRNQKPDEKKMSNLLIENSKCFGLLHKSVVLLLRNRKREVTNKAYIADIRYINFLLCPMCLCG